MAGVEFHTLTVDAVERLTEDAVAVSFEVPEALTETFRYLPGQHVTLRTTIEGTDVRRSYSICADAGTGDVRVGIKRLPGGVFSTWANEVLTPGDQIEVTPPIGEFIVVPDPAEAHHYVGIAAGSGITPVFGQVASILATEPASRYTLIYGNRESRSVMLLEELQGLKDRNLDRFQLIHVLSREDTAVPLFSGRIDEEKLDDLFDSVVATATVDGWYLCGPLDMVEAARRALVRRGVADDLVHDELFFSEPGAVAIVVTDDDVTDHSLVRFELEGRASQVLVDPGGPPILDHALAVRRELPFSCRGGMCTTCRARIVSGEVTMDKNWSLTTDELSAGLILTCQAHPVSDRVELTYDV